MITLFPLTIILSVILYVILGVVLALDILNFIPFFVTVLVCILVFALQICIVKLAGNMYFKTVERADTDLDGFIAEQEKLALRAKRPNIRNLVESNIIAALIFYERCEEAQERMKILGPQIPPNDFLGRLQYVDFLLSIDMHKGNFSGVDYYLNEMRANLSQIDFSRPGLSEKSRQDLYLTVELYTVNAEFYSRPPERLANEDRQITENLISVVHQMEKSIYDLKLFRNHADLSIWYDLGIAYTILGETEKAKQYFDLIVSKPFHWPQIARVKEYLNTGDINILMKYC